LKVYHFSYRIAANTLPNPLKLGQVQFRSGFYLLRITGFYLLRIKDTNKSKIQFEPNYSDALEFPRANYDILN